MSYLLAAFTYIAVIGIAIGSLSKLLDHFHQHPSNDDTDGDFCGWSDGHPVATGQWPDVMAARALNSPVHGEENSRG